MPEPVNDSFRDMNTKGKIVTVIGIALLILFVVSFVFVMYFFGLAGVFELLGVQYKSNWSLVLFVVSFLILGIVAELFTKVIFKLSIRNITGIVKVSLIQIGLESITNWLVLFTVDEFMGSINLNLQSEIIIALLLAVLEFVFTKDKD